MAGALHLIIGPVGAGKSTFARALVARRPALLLVLDDWMARLFGADPRPTTDRVGWYLERRDRCLAQVWEVARGACAAGCDVVLEPGLVRRAERAALYEQIEDAGLALTVTLIDAPRDERRARVMRRNEERGATFAQVVPLEFFELASDHWEPPDDDERHDRGIAAPAQPRA
ncbi:MAG: ATP-binding protein [Myxococcales bacterium]|nr:ATP-binding protein [Myxococcales bacterium]